jgi:hypothetical protein
MSQRHEAPNPDHSQHITNPNFTIPTLLRCHEQTELVTSGLFLNKLAATMSQLPSARAIVFLDTLPDLPHSTEVVHLKKEALLATWTNRDRLFHYLSSTHSWRPRNMGNTPISRLRSCTPRPCSAMTNSERIRGVECSVSGGRFSAGSRFRCQGVICSGLSSIVRHRCGLPQSTLRRERGLGSDLTHYSISILPETKMNIRGYSQAHMALPTV